jgi:hypothetical protein
MALISTEDLVDGVIRNCDEDRCAAIASECADVISDKPISDVMMGLSLIVNDVCEKMARVDNDISADDIRKAFIHLLTQTTAMSAMAKAIDLLDLKSKNWKR